MAVSQNPAIINRRKILVFSDKKRLMAPQSASTDNRTEIPATKKDLNIRSAGFSVISGCSEYFDRASRFIFNHLIA
jgi:hypothetical protein